MNKADAGSYTKFTEDELSNHDQQPALHMHWGYNDQRDRNQWLWDTDAVIKAEAAEAMRRDLDIDELEAASLRAIREIILAEAPRFLNLPSKSIERLQELDAKIKARRTA